MAASEMRRANQETISEGFAQRIAELTARVAAFSRRIQLIIGYRGNVQRAPQSHETVSSRDDERNSIQLLTENDFVIVRPWEAKRLSPPANGRFQFLTQDPQGAEREVEVKIAHALLAETIWRTRVRIESSSEFWMCCAERHLADYLMERGEFPPHNELTVDELDPQDVLLAVRWGKA
jgi:hypothetical protein